MDSSLIFKYKQRANLNTETSVIYDGLNFLENRIDAFYLTSNVETSERGSEWSGFVQNMKKLIRK